MRSILDGIRWGTRLGAKFFWAVPGPTTIVVLATLMSQVGLLVAFFLPLKVIILLGSDGIPRYFPTAFEQYDRDSLIVWLSGATIAFYLLHRFAERVVTFVAGLGARKLLQRHRKIVLFNNQDAIASGAYQRYAGALAGAVFVGLSVLVLAVLYPAVTVLLLTYIVLTGVAILGLMMLNPAYRDRVDGQLRQILRIFAGIGFLVAFAWLVFDFLFRSPPGLMPAIVALLLSRQMLKKLASSSTQFRKLYAQRRKLDALFFHGVAYVPVMKRQRSSFEELIQPERRAQWVPEVLRRVGVEDAPMNLEGDWWPASAQDVACFKVDLGCRKQLMIKLFALGATHRAEHEASLLVHPPDGLPAPLWVGATDVQNHRCHVCQLATGLQPPGQGVTRGHILEIRRNLLAITPGKKMRQRYRRSRALLPQRLDVAWLSQLRPAANAEERASLDSLWKQVDVWRERLTELPVVYTLPRLRSSQISVRSDGGGPCVLHWTNWTMEPQGAGWPVARGKWRALRDIAAIRATHQDAAVLAAFTAQIEKLLGVQSLRNALVLVGAISRLLDGFQAELMIEEIDDWVDDETDEDRDDSNR